MKLPPRSLPPEGAVSPLGRPGGTDVTALLRDAVRLHRAGRTLERWPS